MTHLWQGMQVDFGCATISPCTIGSYTRTEAEFASHFHESSDQLGRPSANRKSTMKAKQENKSGYDFTQLDGEWD